MKKERLKEEQDKVRARLSRKDNQRIQLTELAHSQLRQLAKESGMTMQGYATMLIRRAIAKGSSHGTL